ncbi:MAG: hypothetical protein HKN44_12890 [Ilumatobacter sp.]|nr:hypothetical protein [Ilumatobacter sp.]
MVLGPGAAVVLGPGGAVVLGPGAAVVLGIAIVVDGPGTVVAGSVPIGWSDPGGAPAPPVPDAVKVAIDPPKMPIAASPIRAPWAWCFATFFLRSVSADHGTYEFDPSLASAPPANWQDHDEILTIFPR